ncbi:hypothetical protein [Streptomyces sp. NPDC056056]|uniref:hypothetical protein n=1 Tax=Streptomyces sp. NPDC056056 TaxID=3345698 RepID=UPI0035DA4609
MRYVPRVRLGFRRARRAVPDPSATITHLPGRTFEPDPEPVCTRPAPPAWSLPDEDETRLRTELLLRCGEHTLGFTQ